jgi:hypothetical protein
MLESTPVAEMLVEPRRLDLERTVVRQRARAELGVPETRARPRQMIAGILVRIAMRIDAGAAHTGAAAH